VNSQPPLTCAPLSTLLVNNTLKSLWQKLTQDARQWILNCNCLKRVMNETVKNGWVKRGAGMVKSEVMVVKSEVMVVKCGVRGRSTRRLPWQLVCERLETKYNRKKIIKNKIQQNKHTYSEQREVELNVNNNQRWRQQQQQPEQQQ